MATNNGAAELVLIPTPGMGHLIVAVKLAKLILRRNHRISILVFIITPPMNSTMLDDFVNSQSRDNPYPTRLTYQTLPPLPNPPELSSFSFFHTLIERHVPLVKQAIEDRIRAGSSPRLSGFILDMFCSTMVDVGDAFNVPSYIFFASGASLLNLFFHFGSLVDQNGVDIGAEYGDPDVKFDVPGFKNQLMGKFVPSICIADETGSAMTSDMARRFRKCQGIIVNTYAELETCGLEALFDQVNKGSIPPVYPVGPVLELDGEIRGGTRNKEDEKFIMKWLDGQPTSSVVYLCFGSLGSFDAEQVKEIANGLENSGHRFLWSLRRPPPDKKAGAPVEDETFVEALPQGFLERTADRGKAIGWAPQVSILGHKAVGGFVSHCGWNSTLESLWFGVPMATWPLYAEQQLNAFELVKELGLAVEVRMDYRRDWRTNKGNITVTADEVENGVTKLMSLDQGIRNKVKDMKEKGREVLEDGGSSNIWLGRFIDDVLTFK